MHNQDVFLEQSLLEEGNLTDEQLKAAQEYAQEREVDLVDALIKTEAASARTIALAKAGICEAPYVDLSEYNVNFANTQVVPRSVAERFILFPLFKIDDVLTLAMDDPLNLEAMDQARLFAKCEIDAVLCDREQLRALISRAYRLSQSQRGAEHVEAIEEEEERQEGPTEASQPVVAAVNQLIADAIDQGASDVHVNPDQNDLRLRFRVDGVLLEQQGPPLSMHAGIVQRLKVMANLDLTQTRRPQDGKFRFIHDGAPIDVRMSTLPTVCGENVVLRLLASSLSILDFHELGVPAPMVAELEEMIHRPYGMVLVTGPPGCGKTTTLYTMLHKLNDPSRNIMTIEDPVEIRLPYLRQIQVHAEIGLTFAMALRSIVRQDPDVILVGEIRDNETATIALQAALTGHMVLASFVINSAVLGVVAQRLVRRVCQHCAVPETVDDLMRQRFGLSPDDTDFLTSRGCPRCGHTGFRGRVGLYELLKFTLPVQTLVEQGGSTKKIRERAIREGMRQMWQDGVDKARMGQTTLQEVSKVAAITATVGDAEKRQRMSA
jgi:type IV pilus assembly protein PilB